jgi:hypothetical protein
MSSNGGLAPTAIRPSRRRRRQLGQQAAIKAAVGPRLRQVMEPGEQILAGAYGHTAPLSRRTASAALVASVAFGPLLAGLLQHVTGRASISLLALVSVLGVNVVHLLIFNLGGMRRGVFLAVTDRQLICLTMRDAKPVRRSAASSLILLRSAPPDLPIVRFAVPRTAARLTGGPPGRDASRVTYFGPGARPRGLRITATGIWRQDLDEVVATLLAAGGTVDGYAPAGPLGNPA